MALNITVLAGILANALAAPITALRQVATSTYIPTTKFATTAGASRTRHVARDNITAMGIVLANWYVPTNNIETPSAQDGTVTAAIEYPAGTFTQIKWGGQATGVLPAGANTESDLVPISIPNGADFWIRMRQVMPSGVLGMLYYANDGFSQLQGDANPANVPDYTMGGGNWPTQTVGTVSVMCAPAAIIGMTNKLAVLTVGDSISLGRGDTNNGTRAPLQGHIGRSFGAVVPNGCIGVSGDTMNQFIISHTRRLDLSKYYTHVAINMGINDVTSGRSQAQIQADTDTIVGYFAGKQVALCTMIPVTASTDSWATTANQTLAPTNSVRIAENTRRKSGVSGVKVVYDINTAIESVASPESGLYSAPPALTADGTHLNLAGNAAAAGAITTSLLLT